MATNTQNEIAIPNIASHKEWLIEWKKHLAHEKEATKERDRLNAERRRLPMVRLDKPYSFDGPNGKQSLQDLFDGSRQLIVYHFMFDPAWDKGCSGCTGFVNALGDLSMLPSDQFRCHIPLWYSSFGSDFNYDFHVTLDESVTPVEHNYMDRAELLRNKGTDHLSKGEARTA